MLRLIGSIGFYVAAVVLFRLFFFLRYSIDVLFYAPRKRAQSVEPNGKISLVKCFAGSVSAELREGQTNTERERERESSVLDR